MRTEVARQAEGIMSGNPDVLQREREASQPRGATYIDHNGKQDCIQTSGHRLVRGSDGMLMGVGDAAAARRIAAKLGAIVDD